MGPTRVWSGAAVVGKRCLKMRWRLRTHPHFTRPPRPAACPLPPPLTPHAADPAQVGTPERPLSDLGRVSYHGYWTRILLTILKDHEVGVPGQPVCA